MAARGVSPVVGIVLLVGLTAVVALSVIVVGVTMIDGVQSTAERNQAENSMVELADTANAVASSDARSSEFEFQGADTGSTTVDASAGNVAVVLVNGSRNTTLTNTSLGVYRHETAEGTEIAYQGGGVWRHGSGEPQMIEPPNFDYRAGDVNGSQKPTLRFPYVRIAGPPTDSEGVDGQLTVTEKNEHSEKIENPVTGDYLYVDVESQYCRGWEEHVTEHTDAQVSEGCGDDDQMRVTLSVPDSYTERNVTPGSDGSPGDSEDNSTFGLFAEGDVNLQNSGMDVNASIGATGDIVREDFGGLHEGENVTGATHDRTPHDDEIDRYLANSTGGEQFCGPGHGGPGHSCEYTGEGTYYVDHVPPGRKEATFDVSEGDITLVIEDDLRMANHEWTVEGHEDGGSLNVFVDGDIVVVHSAEIGTAPDARLSMTDPVGNPPTDPDPDAVNIYGRSDATIDISTGVLHLEGSISAPSSTNASSRVFGGRAGSLTLVGSIHAGELDFSSMGGDIYQPRAVGVDDADGSGGGNRTDRTVTVNRTNPDEDLYYVHVSETVAEIDD